MFSLFFVLFYSPLKEEKDKLYTYYSLHFHGVFVGVFRGGFMSRTCVNVSRMCCFWYMCRGYVNVL